MPHQCVHCGKIIESGSKEIFEGCDNCKSRFFFYIRDDQMPKLNEDVGIELGNLDKKQVEKDVRSILGIEEDEKPVILDIESVRVSGPGKWEIDVVSLLNRKPIVIKLAEGKYVIDLESSLPYFSNKEEKGKKKTY